VAQDLVSRLKKEMVTMFGDGQAVTEHSADYARIINSRHTERIHQLLADAVQRGAQVEPLGAANASTRFIPPTLVTDLPADARLLQEEIFGPVLPIVTFRTLQDAEREILSKPKPLGMYIFSRTKANINRLLAATSAGAVVVNDTVLQYTHPHLPFGGVNNSGIGKAHGHYGFLAFSNEKPVIRQKSGQTATYALFPPYRPFQKKIVTAILRWFL
jgi:aldehyde dehydrogenase (NAD+)